MHQEMGGLALDFVGRTLLGINLAADATGIRSALESTLAAFASANVGIAGQVRVHART